MSDTESSQSNYIHVLNLIEEGTTDYYDCKIIRGWLDETPLNQEELMKLLMVCDYEYLTDDAIEYLIELVDDRSELLGQACNNEIYELSKAIIKQRSSITLGMILDVNTRYGHTAADYLLDILTYKCRQCWKHSPCGGDCDIFIN